MDNQKQDQKKQIIFFSIILIVVIVLAIIVNIDTKQEENTNSNENEVVYEINGITEEELEMWKNQMDQNTYNEYKTLFEDYKNGKALYTPDEEMIDENNILQDKGDYKQKVDHLIQSLNHDSNVIVGITYWDKNNRVTNGHELTVVGYKNNKNNELVFILNDTDDEYQKPIEMKAKDLIPRIHHAGIPSELLSDEFKNMDYPKECLDFYNEHIKYKT